MWGHLINCSVIGKQICWTYYLVGSEDDKSNISSYQLGLYGVNKDANKNCFYSIERFYGPIIDIVRHESDGGLSIAFECSNTIPKMFRENYVTINHFDLSVYEKIQIIINSFINYSDLAENINIIFKGESSQCLVNAKKLVQFADSQYEARDKSGYDLIEVDCKDYFDLEFSLKLSFAVEVVEYKLSPCTKKEVVFFEVKEQLSNYSLEGLFIPSVLEYYMMHEFNNYSPNHADEEENSSWSDDDAKDDYYTNHKNWVRDELDDMHQADPNWYWNFD